jgi:fructose/tagatose bisphosphate aldolase
VRIIGAIIDEPIDLENAQIRCEVWLDHCQFNENVTFARANFAGGLLFDGSRFKEEANFNGMKVGDKISFRQAIFEGPVGFVGGDIASNFEAVGAKFKNKKKTASFNSMKVARSNGNRSSNASGI